MAANADRVIRKFCAGTDKTATAGKLINHFILNGYGRARARYWVNEYVDIGLLQIVDKDEHGEPLLTCLWW